MTTKKIIAEIYHTLKISAATFSLVAGLGVTSLYAQGGGPVPPCEQYTVVGADYNCPISGLIGSLVDANCSPISGGVTFLGSVLCVKVIPPSATTNWQTWFEITKRDGSSFTQGGKIIVYIPYEGLNQCFSYTAGGTKQLIKMNYSGFIDNNPYYVYLVSNTTDKFYAGSVTVNNNPRVCKTAPFNGETGVSLNPILTYNTLNAVAGSPNLWQYSVKYRKLGETNWNYTTLATNASVQLTNLSYGSYEWTVISKKSNNNTIYEGEIFTFTTIPDPTPPPSPCYPEIEYLGELAWNTTLAEYTVLSCNDIIDYVENTDDPFWITSVQYNAATGKVEVGMQPNNTLDYRFAILKIYTTAGKRWVWQVQQKPMEFADIIIEPDGNSTTICSPSWLQNIKSNCVLNNDYYITVFADTEENPQGVQIGQMLAGDALANGMQLELPANSQRFSNIKKMRFVLQANYGGYPAGSYLQTSESDYFFAGTPAPVFSHQTTLEACENATFQCRFLSVNNAGNFKYRVFDSKGDVVAETTEYFTTPVGSDNMDFVVKTFDLDCLTESEGYAFTVTPIIRPIVTINLQSTTATTNQPFSFDFSATQAQYPNQPAEVFVSLNNTAWQRVNASNVNGTMVTYTPTQAGMIKFRVDFRGTYCWNSETVSDEITVADVVIPIGNDIYVNATTGNDISGNGTLLSPYKTLTKGLSVITEGNSMIFAGNFATETITIDKNISLNGENNPIVGALLIKTNKIVTVGGNFSIQTDLVVEDGGSLQNIGNTITFKHNATGAGDIQSEVIVEKNLATIYQLKLFGSPVSQVLADLPSNFVKQYKEPLVTNSINQGWQNTTDQVNLAGKGYQSAWQNGTQTLSFWGELNNANSYSVPFSRTIASMVGYQGGYNAISNPFLFNLSWNSIFNSNPNKGLNPTIYFVKATSQTAIQYATNNALTGTSSNGGSNIIGIAQGFYTRKNTVGTENLLISKSNRTNNIANNFRSEVAINKAATDLVRLEISNEGNKSEIVLHTFENSTPNFDELYDAAIPEIGGHLIYLPIGDEIVVDNSIGEKFEGEFPLSIHTQGKTSISTTEKLGNIKVALYDRKTGEKVALAAGVPYEFQSSGKQNDRFVILLGDTVDDYMLDNQLVVYPNPASSYVTITLPIVANFGSGLELQILDMLGREVYKNSNFEKTISLDTKNFAAGIYLVKLSGNGKVMTKKLVIE
jgi:hypothetical protein